MTPATRDPDEKSGAVDREAARERARQHNKRIGERVVAEAAAHEMTIADLARALGVSYESVRKWTVGASAPRGAMVQAIADLLGKSPEWVTHGVDEEKSPGARIIPTRQLANYPSCEALPADSVTTIPGLDPTHPAVEIHTDRLRRLRAAPAHLRAFHVTDSLMEPLLFSGEVAFVDLADDQVRDGSVYAVRFDPRTTLVRRVFRKPRGMTLMADNEPKATIDLGAEDAAAVQVLGRVCFRFGAANF